MAKIKSLETYKKGDKVKVDRGGQGLGIQFLTIKEGFATDNCNGYKDYSFVEEPKLRTCEYYIRPISESDLKLKKLYDETKAGEFEFDYDEVQKTFWESQRENIKNVIGFLNKFLHPYLVEYKHILPIKKIYNWDAFYKEGMHTKNRYIYVIPHDFLNIIVSQSSSNYLTLYITAPSDRYEKEDGEKTYFGVFEISTKYSDDKYVKHILPLVEAIVKKFEEGLPKGFYHISPDYKLVDKVESYKSFFVRGDYNDWSTPIPENYTYTLRELNYLKHYVFNKGFE
jgi:hypothetical protein